MSRGWLTRPISRLHPAPYKLLSAARCDDFVAKLGPGGAVAWATYLGRILDDAANGVVVDAAGNVWVILPILRNELRHRVAPARLHSRWRAVRPDGSGASGRHNGAVGHRVRQNRSHCRCRCGGERGSRGGHRTGHHGGGNTTQGDQHGFNSVPPGCIR